MKGQQYDIQHSDHQFKFGCRLEENVARNAYFKRFLLHFYFHDKNQKYRIVQENTSKFIDICIKIYVEKTERNKVKGSLL